MSGDVSLAVVTAVLGLLTAGVLAVINNGINLRAGVYEDLRTRRLTSRALHRTLRSWYFGQGGLFLSEQPARGTATSKN